MEKIVEFHIFSEDELKNYRKKLKARKELVEYLGTIMPKKIFDDLVKEHFKLLKSQGRIPEVLRGQV